MGNSLPFLRLGATFDPEAVSVMGQALDMACAEFACDNDHDRMEEISAEIIAVASTGERDPARLCAAVIEAFRRIGAGASAFTTAPAPDTQEPECAPKRPG